MTCEHCDQVMHLGSDNINRCISCGCTHDQSKDFSYSNKGLVHERCCVCREPAADMTTTLRGPICKSCNPKHNTDGGKTDFYDTGDSKNVDDLAEHWELLGDEFNCLKAIVGIAKQRSSGTTRHKGTDSNRDANKLLHYAKRIQKRINNDD